VAAAVAAFIILSPTGLATIMRFSDDAGSAMTRLDSVTSFVENWRDYFLAGGGLSAPAELAQSDSLAPSLESTFLFYAVALGIVPTLFYYIAVVRLGGLVNRHHALPWAVVSGWVALIAIQGYSVGANLGNASGIVFIFLGLSSLTLHDEAPPDEAREEERPTLELAPPGPDDEPSHLPWTDLDELVGARQEAPSAPSPSPSP